MARRWFLILFAAVAVVALGLEPLAPAQAAKASKRELSKQQKSLKRLRGQLETLRKEVSSNEAKRTDVSQRLRQAERKISQLLRDIRELSSKRVGLHQKLKQIRGEADALSGRLEAQQKSLAGLIYRQYTQGGGGMDTLQLLLSGENPAQMARDLAYLQSIAQARSKLLDDIRSLLVQKKTLAAQIGQQEADIAAVEQRQKRQSSALKAQRSERKKALEQISGKIKQQKRKISSLERDEKNLSRLINRINKLIAERERRAANERKKARERARLRAKKRGKKGGSAKLARTEPRPYSGAFRRLKGKMGAPAKGKITGRFGQRRSEGTRWKGIFISTRQGAPVKAVARGRVVFADWMSGFGNLLIIDHAGGYLTVYAYNDSLLRRIGDDVKGGDVVASVGNSGGHAKSGLYFEIRYRGKVRDPLKWIRLR